MRKLAYIILSSAGVVLYAAGMVVQDAGDWLVSYGHRLKK